MPITGAVASAPALGCASTRSIAIARSCSMPGASSSFST